MAARTRDPLDEMLEGCQSLTEAAPELAVLVHKTRGRPDGRLRKHIRESVVAIMAIAARIQEHGQHVLDAL